MNKWITSLLLGTSLLFATGCSTTFKSIFDKAVDAPVYVGTIVGDIKTADELTEDNEPVYLYQVSINKVTLYHYYIPVTVEDIDMRGDAAAMYVQHRSDAKTDWTVNGDTVTNHGYTFQGWVTANESTSETSTSQIN